MVYNAGEFQLRETLAEKGETVKNQLGKATRKPTLRWMFQQLLGVHWVSVAGHGGGVKGLTEEKTKILSLFGKEVSAIYNLV